MKYYLASPASSLPRRRASQKDAAGRSGQVEPDPASNSRSTPSGKAAGTQGVVEPRKSTVGRFSLIIICEGIYLYLI